MIEVLTSELETLYSEETVTTNDGVTLTVVESGEWEQDHKSQSATMVFTDGEKHYHASIGRSGSYYSDWDYDSDIYGDRAENVVEVEAREVTRIEWVAV